MTNPTKTIMLLCLAFLLAVMTQPTVIRGATPVLDPIPNINDNPQSTTYNSNYSTGSYQTDIATADNGSQLYIVNALNEVKQYKTTDAYNFTSSTTTQTNTKSLISGTTTGFVIQPNGERFYIAQTNEEVIAQYNMSTAYNVSTATNKETLTSDLSGLDTRDLFFNNDGSKLFVKDSQTDIDEFTLSTPYNIGTASYQTTHSVPSKFTGMSVADNGSALHTVYDKDNTVGYWQAYEVGEPYNFSDLTLLSNTTLRDSKNYDFNPANQEIGYEIGYNSNTLIQWTSSNTINTSENETLAVNITGSDEDGDTLSYGINTSKGTINTSSGLWNWTPNYTDNGSYTFEADVTDGTNTDTETFNVAVTDNNRPPVLDTIPNKTIDAGKTISIDANATDPDPDNTVSYDINTTKGNINEDNGEWTWTPRLTDDDTYKFSINVTDGAGGTDTENFTVTVNSVNAPPVFNTSVDDFDNTTMEKTSQNTISAPQFSTIEWTDNGNKLHIIDFGKITTYEASRPYRLEGLQQTNTITFTRLEDIAVNPNGTRAIFLTDDLRGRMFSYNLTTAYDLSTRVQVENKSALAVYPHSLTVSNNGFTVFEHDSATFSGYGDDIWLRDRNTPHRAGNYVKRIDGVIDNNIGGSDFSHNDTEVVFSSISEGTITHAELGDQDNITSTKTTTDVSNPSYNDISDVETTSNESQFFLTTGNGELHRHKWAEKHVINEGEQLTRNFTATNPDGTGTTPTYKATRGTINQTTGNWAWTPSFDQNGTYHINITANDTIDTTTRQLKVRVLENNGAPVFQNTQRNYTTTENQSIQIEFNATNPDEAGTTPTYEKNMSQGTINKTTGIWEWTPNYTESGEYNFQITANDSFDTTQYDFNVNVTDNNIAPIIEPYFNKSFYADQAFNAFLNATDEEDDQITINTTYKYQNNTRILKPVNKETTQSLPYKDFPTTGTNKVVITTKNRSGYITAIEWEAPNNATVNLTIKNNDTGKVYAQRTGYKQRFDRGGPPLSGQENQERITFNESEYNEKIPRFTDIKIEYDISNASIPDDFTDYDTIQGFRSEVKSWANASYAATATTQPTINNSFYKVTSNKQPVTSFTTPTGFNFTEQNVSYNKTQRTNTTQTPLRSYQLPGHQPNKIRAGQTITAQTTIKDQGGATTTKNTTMTAWYDPNITQVKLESIGSNTYNCTVTPNGNAGPQPKNTYYNISLNQTTASTTTTNSFEEQFQLSQAGVGDTVTCQAVYGDGTRNSSQVQSNELTVGDNLAPTLTNASYPSSAETGETQEFTVDVQEINTVDKVWVNWEDPTTNQREFNLSLTDQDNDDTYTNTYVFNEVGTRQNIRFYARDGSLNQATANGVDNIDITESVNNGGGGGGGPTGQLESDLNDYTVLPQETQTTVTPGSITTEEVTIGNEEGVDLRFEARVHENTTDFLQDQISIGGNNTFTVPTSGSLTSPQAFFEYDIEIFEGDDTGTYEVVIAFNEQETGNTKYHRNTVTVNRGVAANIQDVLSEGVVNVPQFCPLGTEVSTLVETNETRESTTGRLDCVGFTAPSFQVTYGTIAITVFIVFVAVQGIRYYSTIRKNLRRLR